MPGITPQTLEELRQLARKATPGPWIYDWNFQRLKSREGFQIAATRDINGADAEYLEKVSPDLLLALLEELEILHEERRLLLKYALSQGYCPSTIDSRLEASEKCEISDKNPCGDHECRQCWSEAIRRHAQECPRRRQEEKQP